MTVSPLLETHQSFWIASTLQSSYPSLSQDIEVDVAIVGAGLAGITTAMLLKKAGKRVAVLEADRVAEGVSGHTTAKVTSLHQLKYDTLIKEVGVNKARLYGESNQAAIEQIAALVKDEQIDCDFERKDAYTFAESQQNLTKVKQEVEAAQKLGLPATFEKDIPLPFATLGAVKFSQQAQFHPRKYILALAGKIDGNGSYVFEQTRVKTVAGEDPCQVRTQNGFTVTARDVVITTNLPILDQGLFFAKTFPKRSYLIGFQVEPDQVPGGMFIGTGETYRSIRATPTDDGGTIVLVGGEGHKVGEASDTPERFNRLAEYARDRFGATNVDYYWSSQDMVSFDKLPYIGKLTPANQHTYVATGFSLWGMSNSTLSAMLLRDLILGQKNPWADLYEATRATPFMTQKSLKNNLDVGSRWVGDRLKGLFDNPNQIKPNEGKLVTVGTDKIAAYRDESGTLHQVSAVCPHLGCIVDWNQAEKSWDCPCHGSRFDVDGKILHGPAVNELKPKGS
ncbi:FAD-dependent oxidoreductase [Oscillatoria sp. CS-180]|uniref:FAD-dependent oxidoreductase n=1 Tax=Oscillatoria sp. CS-180 TaxID=3021720 RepID=UPI00232F1E53|nr:FAD-dependent oxidoreductase [Oscillatoria sp. CS-180]MDB9527491.1 FAD-dependent oxidoreductase [Oscillatoria sp. CS-180]